MSETKRYIVTATRMGTTQNVASFSSEQEARKFLRAASGSSLFHPQTKLAVRAA